MVAFVLLVQRSTRLPWDGNFRLTTASRLLPKMSTSPARESSGRARKRARSAEEERKRIMSETWHNVSHHHYSRVRTSEATSTSSSLSCLGGASGAGGAGGAAGRAGLAAAARGGRGAAAAPSAAGRPAGSRPASGGRGRARGARARRDHRQAPSLGAPRKNVALAQCSTKLT